MRKENVKIGLLIILHTYLTLLIIDYRYRKAVYSSLYHLYAKLQKVHKTLDAQNDHLVKVALLVTGSNITTNE